MLRDYEIELLEKMVQEEQYKNNIPLCTPFIKDFLEEYKKLIDRATPKKPILANGNKCPNCSTLMQWEYPYCPFCGQAIDWSE